MDGYADDPTIRDDAVLWRRVPVDPIHYVFDQNLGRVRPSSAAFEDSPDGTPMSVQLAQIVAETGRGPEDVLVGYHGFALAAITAGLSRGCRQGVARAPLPDEPAHAVVFGTKTRKIRGRLAKGSQWVIPPSSLPEQPAGS